MTEEKKPKTTQKQQSKKPMKAPEKPKDVWVHVDDYLSTSTERDELKQGFRIYMRKKAYQRSYEAFDAEFKNFLERKI